MLFASAILCQALQCSHCTITIPLAHARGFTNLSVLPPHASHVNPTSIDRRDAPCNDFKSMETFPVVVSSSILFSSGPVLLTNTFCRLSMTVVGFQEMTWLCLLLQCKAMNKCSLGNATLDGCARTSIWYVLLL